jgi:hypothetical protein
VKELTPFVIWYLSTRFEIGSTVSTGCPCHVPVSCLLSPSFAYIFAWLKSNSNPMRGDFGRKYPTLNP